MTYPKGVNPKECRVIAPKIGLCNLSRRKKKNFLKIQK